MNFNSMNSNNNKLDQKTDVHKKWIEDMLSQTFTKDTKKEE